jgi:hypothetical protein
MLCVIADISTRAEDMTPRSLNDVRRFEPMKRIRAFLLMILAFCIAVSLGMGKAEYAKKEAKACTYCHPPGKFKELTEAGKYYKDHNHSLEGYKEKAKESK